MILVRLRNIAGVILSILVLLSFQNCGLKSTATGVNTDAGNDVLDTSVPTKVVVGEECTFVVMASGNVLFAGNGYAACIKDTLDGNPPDENVTTPSERNWLPKNIVDVKTAYFADALFLSRDGQVTSLLGNTNVSGIKAIALGAFGRQAMVRTDGTYVTYTGAVGVASTAAAVIHPALFGAKTPISPYACEYLSCGVVGSTVKCSNLEQFNCSPGVWSPPTNLTNTSLIEGTYNHMVFAIQNGALWQFGSPTATAIPQLSSGVAAVSANLNSACAIKDGNVYCWGKNAYGELGTGDKIDVTVPTLINGLSNIVQISMSEDHTCAIADSGRIWCWGANNKGQLGDGTLSDRLTPTEMVIPGH